MFDNAFKLKMIAINVPHFFFSALCSYLKLTHNLLAIANHKLSLIYLASLQTN